VIKEVQRIYRYGEQYHHLRQPEPLVGNEQQQLHPFAPECRWAGGTGGGTIQLLLPGLGQHIGAVSVRLGGGLRVNEKRSIGVFLCLFALGQISCDGLYADRVVLSDWSAHSVAIARDIPTFKILLAARPSYAWRVYFSDWIAGSGLEKDLAARAGGYAAALNAGMIVWLPNGTLANDRGWTKIPRIGPSGPRYGGFAQAVKIRVREGPNRSLEGWTLPDLMQRQGNPIP
jgi:hypothetical protein